MILPLHRIAPGGVLGENMSRAAPRRWLEPNKAPCRGAAEVGSAIVPCASRSEQYFGSACAPQTDFFVARDIYGSRQHIIESSRVLSIVARGRALNSAAIENARIYDRARAAMLFKALSHRWSSKLDAEGLFHSVTERSSKLRCGEIA
jgi:hypothetical protein